MYPHHQIFSLLDLTSLNDTDTPEHIAALCAKAVHPDLGQVAAVCVYPQFVAQARSLLPDSIQVATVTNFPQASDDIETVCRQTEQALDDGAGEIDLVFPYRHWQRGETAFAAELAGAVAESCRRHNALLKVILETGELSDEHISATAAAAIRAGADFLKTSTGKTPQGATPAAAALMLQAIAQSGRTVGLKLSGGIREIAAAEAFMRQAEQVFGSDYLQAATFRIGASALADRLAV